LDDYAKELEEVPFFIEKMTEYIGPYIWGDYKIVILP
jgi:leukotriene-A4 hydrolase